MTSSPITETVTLSQAKELIRCLSHEQSVLVLSPPGDLVNGAGDLLTLTNLSFDSGGPIRTLTPASQVFFVGIGGQVFVRSNQEDGTYTGTFTLTANYF